MEELEPISIRLPKTLVSRISFIQKTHEERTGFHLSKTSIIRTLLEEAIKNRESKSSHPSSPKLP